MESRGIVRRVDELGRIVLPREMRKMLNIREGTKLEIGIVDGNKFLLSKHSPVMELKSYAQNIVDAIASSVENEVLMCDMEEVIYSNKRKYIGKKLTIQIQDLICNREPIVRKETDGSEMLNMFENFAENNGCQLLVPIVKDGDAIGVIMILTPVNFCFNDEAIKVCKAFSNFICSLMP